MSKKLLIKSFFAIAICGFILWATIPLFVDKEVSESAPDQATTIPASSSTINYTETEPKVTPPVDEPLERISEFEGRNNYDAEGTVKLIEDTSGKRYVRFEDNFRADNGPDLIVYIGTVEDRGTSLGALKGNIGAQNYEIPDGLDLATVDTIRVFCRAFNADFAIATL